MGGEMRKREYLRLKMGMFLEGLDIMFHIYDDCGNQIHSRLSKKEIKNIIENLKDQAADFEKSLKTGIKTEKEFRDKMRNPVHADLMCATMARIFDFDQEA